MVQLWGFISIWQPYMEVVIDKLISLESCASPVYFIHVIAERHSGRVLVWFSLSGPAWIKDKCTLDGRHDVFPLRVAGFVVLDDGVT